MSITVLNYMDHTLVSRINEQAAKRAEAAKQSNTDDFAAALADSTKDFGKQPEYLTDRYHRRRYIRDIRSPDNCILCKFLYFRRT